MPRLLHGSQRAGEEHEAEKLTKSLPRTASDLAAQSLANLWRRLFQSYVHFTQPGCLPFVADVATYSEGVDSVADSDTALDALWAAGFDASSTPDALIVHLFLANKHLDAVSWIIAFCLVDRLQLSHYVRQRLRELSFLQQREDSSNCFLRLAREHVPQLLFTAYSLAFKWHLDYTVSVKYLTNLLPHTRSARGRILRCTIKEELVILETLEFNCAVSHDHLLQLMDHFLTASERRYVLQVVHRV
ncbi:conserved hypothetical protein [Leishmania major strain Friedlin]|uniref:Uncharacterized protein n=1 Tax=Leishmania major TaxID=5664 RepID=E9AEE4_LEIMA|nr:conserved hypothetical protein [Leishmania major strain Friedlin]CAG9578024.1 hypothetical_protein_-_conserved [Leishmania major strain Friedlin]CBZ12623.1 conserved hypothetical protein [Leishmania major strain Friedlin]|eukprot:XP_003722365.1 conserved hypothetical protein [Leishmania major strain Friedlin]